MAQDARAVFDLFGGMMQSAIAQATMAEWRKIPAAEGACIDQALRARGTSLQVLAQRGVQPSDVQIAELRSACRGQPTQPAGLPASAWAVPYSVDGLALGSRVRFETAAYREYQCGPSEQFDGFVWCQRSRVEREPRGQFTSSYSILHAADGAVAYVNRALTPAFFDGREAQDEVDRLSRKYGAPPRVLPMPAGLGRPAGFIAVWGNVALNPLDDGNIKELAAGRSIRAGLLIDHIGSYQRSAQTGLPVYRFGGGPGYVWSGSWDERGRGSLRFLAIDPSAIARTGDSSVAAPAAPPPIPTERERIEAGGPSRPGMTPSLDALGAPGAGRGDRSRLGRIPESCEVARRLGQGQLALVDPLSNRRSPGPACQAILSCKTDLARQTRDVFLFLRDNPDVTLALRSAAPGLFQNGSFTSQFVRDLEGAARRLDSITPSAPCTYVWGQIDMHWIDLGGKNAVAHSFQDLMEGGQALFSKVRSELDAAEAEYRALLGFNDRYAGVEKFERAYQSYAEAVQVDDIVATLRQRSGFLAELEIARGRKQMLSEQSAKLSGLTTSLSDMSQACGRESLAHFSNQDLSAMVSALQAESKKLADASPAQRGDLSSQMEILAARHRDLESAVRAARSEKARIEDVRMMLSKRESLARQLADSASHEDLTGGLDPQLARSANDLAEQLRQFRSLDLGTIRKRQGDLIPTLEQLVALEKRFLSARSRYDEAKALDERRRAALSTADLMLDQLSKNASSRLSTEAGSQLANLRARRALLVQLDSTKLLERPDYGADLAAVEDVLARLDRTRDEIDDINRLAADLKALKVKIDGRGRKSLDAATASDLAEIEKSTASLVSAKVPLTSDARETIVQVRSRLERLASSVDAVMDVGALAPDSRMFLTAHPEYRERSRTEGLLLAFYSAEVALEFCNNQSWLGFGPYRQPLAEARRRTKILEEIFVQILHEPASEIDRFKVAMKSAKEQIHHQMKWDRVTPPEKACDELVMMLQLNQPW
ncbi:hypothetical protein CH341_26785 [Rhodoplanes roseus]|uniref:Uncharacterized protein n=1 Tax=Rhodoplanes roseus TaxID=29409 RepID=A0A327KLN8_9BRAD|nr:hypothetical protein CH341_26785 [Rhodoplanes roseus]